MALQLVFYALGLIAPVWSYTVDDCPAILPRDRYLQVHGSSCYTYVPHAREFPTAESECRSRGGHLVVIRDADTQQFLYNTYYIYSSVVWIGLSDVRREGAHEWVDGSPLTYTHWAPGEPSGSEYDCTVMDMSRGRGQWVDLMCQNSLFNSHSHTFICENKLGGAAVSTTAHTNLSVSQQVINGCPTNLPANSNLYVHGSSCYDFVKSHALEFNAAERECELRNGHLVTIHDPQTQQFIYQTLVHDLNYHGEVWIGMTDQRQEGFHVWVDGSPISYVHWAAGEPTGQQADCAIMRLDDRGLWYDFNCADMTGGFMQLQNGHHYFVCEYPLAGTATTTHVPTAASHYTVADCPPGTPLRGHLFLYGSSCYDFVLSQPLEFNDAERSCRANHGHLVTIRDAGTQNFIYQTFQRYFPRAHDVIWIGMTDQQYEGMHVWVDGSPVTYTHWAAGEPTGIDSDCAIMNLGGGGLWYDYECSEPFPIFGSLFGTTSEHYYVCEYPIVKTTTPNMHISTTVPTTTTSVIITTGSGPTTATTTELPTTTTFPTTPTTTPAATTTTTAVPATTTTTTAAEPTTASTPEPTPEPTEPTPTPAEVTSPHGHSSHGHSSTACPPFECGLDCGEAGFRTDANDCQMCECAEVVAGPTCPPFDCGLDCGLSGYLLDPQGCMMCQCES